jgi:putative tryptophan/tyrosine transport system substrate-binding protein
MKKAAVLSILVGVTLLGVAVIAEAQQPAKVGKIGWLSIGSDSGPGSTIRGVLAELRALGYVEGKNIAFDYRYADNKLDRLPALADELVRLKVNVLVTPGTPAAIAAKNATRTIPIVFFAYLILFRLGWLIASLDPGEMSRGSPRFRRCWVANDWSCSKKRFLSSPT